MTSFLIEDVEYFLTSNSCGQAVNDMLLTSQGHGLRLFPIWAAIRPTESASFRTLRSEDFDYEANSGQLGPIWGDFDSRNGVFDPRAKGAFLVSAAYDGVAQRVGNVTILSEAGVLCRVLSPWPRGAAITVTNGGTAVRAKAGPRGWLEFATEAGHLYELAAA